MSAATGFASRNVWSAVGQCTVAVALAAALLMTEAVPAFVLAFVAAPILVVAVRDHRFAWAAGLALTTGVLVWLRGLGLVAVWSALALLAACALSMYLCTRYVASEGDGHAHLGLSRTRAGRALLVCGIAVLAAILTLLAVGVGQQSNRAARHARSNDEFEAAARATANRLLESGEPSAGAVPDEWRSVLVEAAKMSGRSVYLFSPDEGGRKLVAGARWDSASGDHVTAVRSFRDLPSDERRVLLSYLIDPIAHTNAERTWVLPVGGVPFVRSIFSAEPGNESSVGLDLGSEDWTRDRWVLLLSPSGVTEWWSTETRLEYARQGLGYVMWAVVVAAGLSSLLLRLSMERMALLSRLSAAEEREAIRRDAHDRIYNRLAAVAHGLEAPGADGRVARGAAFEIRSTVDYLQTILRGEAEDSGEGVRVALESQLRDIAASAERIWGIDVQLDVQPGIELDSDMAWDVQCLVDEALANAGEHSGARRAIVRVERCIWDDHPAIVFSVSDDGAWQAPAEGRESTGLVGMRSRVAQLGGTIAIDKGDGGSTVVITLPCG